jgi:hypothetical protein
MDLEHKVASQFQWYHDRTRMKGREIGRRMKWIETDAEEFIKYLNQFKGVIQDYYDHCHMGRNLLLCSKQHFRQKHSANDYSVCQLGWKLMRKTILLVCKSIHDAEIHSSHKLVGSVSVTFSDCPPSLYVMEKDYPSALNPWKEMEEWLASQGYPYKCHKIMDKNDCAYCMIFK